MRLLCVSHRAWPVMFTKLLNWITPKKKKKITVTLVNSKSIAPLISVLALAPVDLSSSIFFFDFLCLCSVIQHAQASE